MKVFNIDDYYIHPMALTIFETDSILTTNYTYYVRLIMTNIPELAYLVSRWNDSQEEYILHNIENLNTLSAYLIEYSIDICYLTIQIV